ncbi:MAG: hypothetical protein ACP5PX_08275 [Candidatus Hadarchaeum sp.]|uniref:hypothetical protein n=1 Tax=Candidatus Hadarchaeum sp. TaxID=2883567 RepID=UPI003D14D654
MTEQITDSQVLTSLLAEENLNGYTIKPWTIKQLLQVMPILDRLAEELGKKEISFESLDRLVEEHGVSVLKDLLQAAMPQLPDFLAISLKKEKAEMEELDLGQALQIGVKVLALNVEHLKNAFNLVLGEAGTLTR